MASLKDPACDERGMQRRLIVGQRFISTYLKMPMLRYSNIAILAGWRIDNYQ